MSVTIKDIAKAAGVSRGTVDRVLHNRAGVSPDAVKRVREIADAMGFVPNRAGKILAARKQPLKFGCLLPDVGNPFFLDVISGFRKAEAELADYGVSVDICHVRGFDSAAHKKMLEKMASAGYSGICCATVDLPEIQLAIHSLIEEGIPVIAVNTDIPDSGRLCYVGPDYFNAGLTSAAMVALTAEKDLHILVVTGSFHIRGHNDRIRGFFRGLSDHKASYSVIQTIESSDDDEKAYEMTKQILRENEEINCIFIAAAGVEGVCRAVQELGKNSVTIAAFDETEETVKYLKAGLIDFTISQEPELQGYTAVTTLFSYLMSGGIKKPEDFITGTIIKVPENLGR
ncbi:MAG: LacI family DNA-binding transcriptional regulator [Treponema sp.]|jgi:LacI family transcriptional regulator|nr:LacI family DNA-binding transcriptional regulator [Treponema sp.]